MKIETAVLIASRSDPEHKYCFHIFDPGHPQTLEGYCASCHREQLDPHIEIRWVDGQLLSPDFMDPVPFSKLSELQFVEVKFGSHSFTPSQWKTFGSPYVLYPDEIALMERAIQLVRNAIHKVSENSKKGISNNGPI